MTDRVNFVTFPLTRAGPVGVWTPPSGFSKMSQKQWRGAPPFLIYLFTLLFRTCENFRPRSLKVKSPGHVKWPHHRKKRMVVIATLNKHSAIHIRNGIYEMAISEFWYQWPKCRSILRLLHYKSMGQKWKAPLLDENHSKHSQTSGYWKNWHPKSEIYDQWPLVMSPWSLLVMKGRQQ